MLRISLRFQLDLSKALKVMQISENLFFSEVTWTSYQNVFEFDNPYLFLGDDLAPVYLPDLKDMISSYIVNPLVIKKMGDLVKNPVKYVQDYWKLDGKYTQRLIEYTQRRKLDTEDFFSHIKYEDGWDPLFNPDITIKIKSGGSFKDVSTKAINRALMKSTKLKALLISDRYKSIIDYEAQDLGINLSTLYKHIEWTTNYEFECREEDLKVSLRNGEEMYLVLEEFKNLCLGKDE